MGGEADLIIYVLFRLPEASFKCKRNNVGVICKHMYNKHKYDKYNKYHLFMRL